MIRQPETWAVAACVLACTAGAGCASNEAFHCDRQTVWRVAVGEAIAWSPDRIDDKNFRIESLKKDLTGLEMQFIITIETDYNPFAARPSTRVFVLVEQTEPKRLRYTQTEQEFLTRIRVRLEEYARAAAGG